MDDEWRQTATRIQRRGMRTARLDPTDEDRRRSGARVLGLAGWELQRDEVRPAGVLVAGPRGAAVLDPVETGRRCGWTAGDESRRGARALRRGARRWAGTKMMRAPVWTSKAG